MVTDPWVLSGSIGKDTVIELCVTLDDSDGIEAYTDYTTVMPGLEISGLARDHSGMGVQCTEIGIFGVL